MLCEVSGYCNVFPRTVYTYPPYRSLVLCLMGSGLVAFPQYLLTNSSSGAVHHRMKGNPERQLEHDNCMPPGDLTWTTVDVADRGDEARVVCTQQSQLDPTDSKVGQNRECPLGERSIGCMLSLAWHSFSASLCHILKQTFTVVLNSSFYGVISYFRMHDRVTFNPRMIY